MMKESDSLHQKKCLPCKQGTPPLNDSKQQQLLAELSYGWSIKDGRYLEKEYSFPDFRQALSFTNRIGEIAEREGHHPDITLSWGKVKLLTWTHASGGLTESDFILAAKCDLEKSLMISEKACF